MTDKQAPTSPRRSSYERALVTFIDVLGFRSIVSTMEAKDIDNVIQRLRNISGADQRDTRKGDARVLAFSDSIIRVLPAAVKSGLFYELLDLLHIQANMAATGVLIRGGVTIGEVFLEGDTLFGPAFVNAYDLESKFAVYPRIVVDPRVLNALNRGELPTWKETREEYEFVSGLVTRGDDGVWFIDYLKAFAEECEYEEYAKWLSDHKQTVSKLASAASKADGLTSLSLKSNWLARYHNQAIAKLSDEWFKHVGAERAELTVPES